MKQVVNARAKHNILAGEKVKQPITKLQKEKTQKKLFKKPRKNDIEESSMEENTKLENSVTRVICNEPIVINDEEENQKTMPKSQKNKNSIESESEDSASELVLLDSIEVKEGNKNVKITLTKQKNRTVRIQFFLNGHEIRNSTFVGTSPARNYWTLLKGLLK